ncbi:MAG: hypothetical protein A2402_01475 [Candidatus Staskawiczbacteria bacterium RIFOXYC1_FULL_37_43]|nr:MAG: hypothetical protein A2813_00135 [Candidatus Staskawiczbacteria bacterium RIFCSPHIGHO2_01_FULL_37_17]OGZ71974.1 MAG: hypothetical protein A2891_03450 [Candidatus Staskawiczbacteria bacterium RIFCSPLOWO2_01_FULL_37_19]OGZ75513.1 MAG: hypothetical protein A2205_01920 [Candidatus Staskawiczbacteria bacterium RIFOXYA1_FULL_37_15]OGZ80501.1 MAG: hypothetical protein A2353_03185 [Candidatus Staskawiczbacteria bacterium RIFOXYB1_FULL_38_37]OGZ82199.1 MAG: hypothetical protein A2402_01475 [Cand
MSVRFATVVSQNLPDISVEKMEWLMKHPKILRIFLAPISSRRFFRETREKLAKKRCENGRE